MKEFISEYGMMILEGLGGSIVIGLLYATFFSNGAFVSFVNQFLATLIGG